MLLHIVSCMDDDKKMKVQLAVWHDILRLSQINRNLYPVILKYILEWIWKRVGPTLNFYFHTMQQKLINLQIMFGLIHFIFIPTKFLCIAN